MDNFSTNMKIIPTFSLYIMKIFYLDHCSDKLYFSPYNKCDKNKELKKMGTIPRGEKRNSTFSGLLFHLKKKCFLVLPYYKYGVKYQI